MIVAMLLSLAAVGQDATQSKCPTVNVSGEDSEDAGKAVFSINLSGGDPKVEPSYNWSISAGSIEGGQGTASITVHELEKGQFVTATAEVGGYDRDCSSTASASVAVE